VNPLSIVLNCWIWKHLWFHCKIHLTLCNHWIFQALSHAKTGWLWPEPPQHHCSTRLWWHQHRQFSSPLSRFHWNVTQLWKLLSFWFSQSWLKSALRSSVSPLLFQILSCKRPRNCFEIWQKIVVFYCLLRSLKLRLTSSWKLLQILKVSISWVDARWIFFVH